MIHVRPRLSCLLALLIAASCAKAPPVVEHGDFAPSEAVRQASARGLDYLAATTGEFGLDVAVALQIVGNLTGRKRALAIAETRRHGLRTKDLDQLGALLSMDKPVMPPADLLSAGLLTDTPDPAFVLAARDQVTNECLAAVVRCEVPARCRRFAEADDYWGYALTHQAVWVLFAYWKGCAIDLEPIRQSLAVRLIAEATADSGYSQLAAERIAVLGHMGFAAFIQDEWVEALLAAQTDEGCWGLTPDAPCHPHPTGVALWALAVATEPASD